MNYYEAFSELKWFDDANIVTNLQSDDESTNYFWETWTFRFYFTTIASILNMILIIAAYSYIKRGTLGIDPKTGDSAAFPQVQYFVSLLVNLLANTLFSIIIGNFTKLFACDFDGDDPANWHLQLRDDLVCFEGDHLLYGSISGVLLMSYYLSTIILFPSFQFDEPSLDIKFTANFIILKTQCEVLQDFIKVLISGKDKSNPNRLN